MAGDSSGLLADRCSEVEERERLATAERVGAETEARIGGEGKTGRGCSWLLLCWWVQTAEQRQLSCYI